MSKLTINFNKIWSVAVMLFLICSTAFVYGDLSMLNKIAYIGFLIASVFCLLFIGKLRITPSIVMLIAYAIIMIVGAVYTPATREAASERIYNFLVMAAVAFCLVQYIRTVKNLHVIMVSYMLAGLALSLYVYIQYGNQFWTLLEEAAKSDLSYFQRLDGDLANANTISMAAMISVVIAVYYIGFTKVPLPYKLGCLAIAAFCLVVSFAAASKKSIILAVVSIFCFWFYGALGDRNFLKELRSMLIFIAVLFVVAFALNNVTLFSGVMRRFDTLTEFLQGGKGSVSERHRMMMLSEGLEVWLKHPIFGAGTYSSQHYFGVYSHSNPVEILMNSGAVGFVVFYGIYFLAAYQYIKNARYYKAVSNLSMLLFALFLGVAVCGVVMVYYYDRYYMLLTVTVFSAASVFKKEYLQQLNTASVEKIKALKGGYHIISTEGMKNDT